ncbi:hypothetical protein Tco_0819120 [Tanacetum coccineum]|uniref:Uncharacterized protein n=1 Tax=Tanacetum coccineum TaxID=301880 RepID=A0ABQ5A5L9_9ASTR
MENTCSGKENSNSETTCNKLVKETSLDSETKDVHAIKYKMSKAKERCKTYFQSLHSHLQVLSKEDLKGTRIEHGFKRAFMSLFGQDDGTFTSTMFLIVDQLQKPLDKDEQEDGSMAAFWVFRDIILQHTGNVTKSVAERTRHQRQYNKRVNKRQMQTQKSEIDTGKALDADLVVIESSGTESDIQDANNSILSNLKSLMKIFTGHRFSSNKTSVVYEKTSPRSDLSWNPTGRIFKIVGLRWVPTGKILVSCISKDDNEPTHGSNIDIPNIHECKQTLGKSQSLVAEKADISETSVPVDSQLVNKNDDI